MSNVSDEEHQLFGESLGILDEIKHERRKQVEKYSAENDDAYENGQLAESAARFILHETKWALCEKGKAIRDSHKLDAQWQESWLDRFGSNKPTERQRLIIAAALIVAEIARLDRKEEKAKVMEYWHTAGKLSSHAWNCFRGEQESFAYKHGRFPNKSEIPEFPDRDRDEVFKSLLCGNLGFFRVNHELIYEGDAL